jgi:hypothetical protein
MAINEKETITSVDFNFSNGGGSHTALVKTVLNAKDLTDNEDELGSLIGLGANRTTFSNSQIQSLMNNFIEVERTVSKNANTTTVSRKYEDVTSLKLKSHCFVLRGLHSHPHDKGISNRSSQSRSALSIMTGAGERVYNITPSSPNSQFSNRGDGEEVIIPYFSELPNSPISVKDQQFPFRQPKKNGGVILIGNIYNEESSVASTGEKVSLVYQDKEVKEELSYNLDKTSEFYKNNPDLANYNLNYGYTLGEAKKGFASAGISIVGLPEQGNDKVLFKEAGTLDSVLSAIASKYGYYWFVDPFSTGTVRFVNSSSASQTVIPSPLQDSEENQSKYINASYTKSYVQPKIVNAFNSTIEKGKVTFDFAANQRYTRFNLVEFNSFIELLGIPPSLVKIFYGIYLAGRFEPFVFDAVAYFVTYYKKKFVDWGDWWDDHAIFKENKPILAGKFAKGKLMEKIKEELKQPFNLDTAAYLRISGKSIDTLNPEQPSKTKAFAILKDFFDFISSQYYISNKFNKYKARRMQWGGSPMRISGPYLIGGKDTKKIKEVDELQTLQAVLARVGKEDESIDKLFSTSSGLGDHAFLGVVNNNNRISLGKGKDKINYDIINPKNFMVIKKPFGATYVAWQPQFAEEVAKLSTASVEIFDEILEKRSEFMAKSMKAYYTRGKKPTDEPENEETKAEEEAETRRQAGLDSAAERLAEVSERFDIRYYNLRNNGAFGSPLNPINLDVKEGKISDILALESSNYSYMQSNAQPLTSSNVTIAGLSIPSKFDITLSSLSIQLTSSGVNTTISRSTKKLIPPSQQITIDSASQAFASNNAMTRLSASQRNVLGL